LWLWTDSSGHVGTHGVKLILITVRHPGAHDLRTAYEQQTAVKGLQDTEWPGIHGPLDLEGRAWYRRILLTCK